MSNSHKEAESLLVMIFINLVLFGFRYLPVFSKYVIKRSLFSYVLIEVNALGFSEQLDLRLLSLLIKGP